jgi:hypothetical protein
MYRVYAVNYDLRVYGTPNYADLEAELKRSPNWWHYLQSTWLIATDETATELWNRIAPHVRKIDSVLIIEVCQNVSGWLPQKAWEWIRANVPGWVRS